ncbi:hypothetical protein KP509_11G051300 [Ceratopteris richardii]|uniref:C2 domain-containing protein n=1 Tax=Ceratopteris richardii TaxID=49495 RepID=A0A8T2TPE5_CERRI|nr:hypothetical protein KP509_11G051300 [Ceratopteris richardii]
MTMEYRKLDVTVVSAENVKRASLFGKLRTYAVVWVEKQNRCKTRVDEHGNTNPSWNDSLSFSVPESLFCHPGSYLHVEIYRARSIFGDKFLSMASIPLSGLLQKPDGKEIMMYELRRRTGKRKGAVRLSVRVGEKTTMSSAGHPALPAGDLSGVVTAYPVDPQKPCHVQEYAGYTHPYPPQMTSHPYPPQMPPQPYPPHGSYRPHPPQGYYAPQQGYYQQTQFVQQPLQRPGGMGLGTGLLAGALGGLLVGEMVDDIF